MTPRAAPTRAWGKRQWVRLFASILGLAMVAGSSWYVLKPQLTRSSQPHGVGSWICDRLYPPTRQGGFFVYTIFIHASPCTNRLITCTPAGIEDRGDPEAFWSDPGAAPRRGTLWAPAEHRTAWVVSGAEHHETNGVWASTSMTHAITTNTVPVITWIGMDVGPNPPIPDAQVGAMYWDAMSKEGKLEFPQALPGLIASGAWTGSTVRWSGYLLNTATLLGLGMFLWLTPLTIRDAWRAWRFRAATACKSCGYDLRGLAPNTALCPECGASISPGLEAHP